MTQPNLFSGPLVDGVLDLEPAPSAASSARDAAAEPARMRTFTVEAKHGRGDWREVYRCRAFDRRQAIGKAESFGHLASAVAVGRRIRAREVE